MKTQARKTTLADWNAEGAALFGPDQTAWRFVCPCCGHIAAMTDWQAAGAPSDAVGFSCVGRWTAAPRRAFGKGPGPCDYAGGGLFGLNPVSVVTPEGSAVAVFEFARDTPEGGAR